jgi:ABC-type transport system substrate-binding protein
MKEIGIDLDFEVVEWNALTAIGRMTADMPEMRSRKISAINISRATIDPYFGFARLLGSAYTPPRGGNWGKISDPGIDRLFEELFASFDDSERTRLVQKVHERAVDNAYRIWICHDLNPRAMSPKVKGFVQAQSWFQDLTPVTMQ